MKHVLIVEDHARLRNILKMALAADGYQTTAAASGDEAIALLESGLLADIVLTDIRMPGRCSGLGLAHWVREHRPNMAVLLQTGFAQTDTGDVPLLRKPFTLEVLTRCIRNLLTAKS
jgi:CheY-like chemotaxis protein